MRAEHGEFLQISGLRVTYDLAAKPAIVIKRKIVQPGSRVSNVMVQTNTGWVPLNDNDVYTVGTIDYAAKFWDVLSSKDANTTEMAALDDYFGEVLHRRTAPKTDGRIRILVAVKTLSCIGNISELLHQCC